MEGGPHNLGIFSALVGVIGAMFAFDYKTTRGRLRRAEESITANRLALALRPTRSEIRQDIETASEETMRHLTMEIRLLSERLAPNLVTNDLRIRPFHNLKYGAVADYPAYQDPDEDKNEDEGAENE